MGWGMDEAAHGQEKGGWKNVCASYISNRVSNALAVVSPDSQTQIIPCRGGRDVRATKQGRAKGREAQRGTLRVHSTSPPSPPHLDPLSPRPFPDCTDRLMSQTNRTEHRLFIHGDIDGIAP